MFSHCHSNKKHAPIENDTTANFINWNITLMWSSLINTHHLSLAKGARSAAPNFSVIQYIYFY